MTSSAARGEEVLSGQGFGNGVLMQQHCNKLRAASTSGAVGVHT